MNRKTISAIALTALLGGSQFLGTAANAAEVNRYNFDQVVKNTNNSNFNASIYTIGDEATLGLFRNGTQGLAMRFPAMDTNPDTDGALLEIKDNGSDRLDPGTENMQIQVSVRLDPSLADNGIGTSQGMNIVQKGAFADAQWKLQIDRNNGVQVLGCRFAQANAASGSAEEAFATLVASGNNADVNLFNGSWRTIRCRRDGNTVTLSVGNNVNQAFGNLGSISSDEDVNIGGLRRNNDLVNDQYHGEMDNLIITIGD